MTSSKPILVDNPSIPVFIDTNVIVYYLADNHAEYSPRCTALIERLASGTTTAVSAATAVFEALHVLHKNVGIPRPKVAAGVGEIVRIQAISFDHREAILGALRFWTEQPALDFADCYHLALTKSLGLDAIYTFDKKMDRYPGVARLEP